MNKPDVKSRDDTIEKADIEAYIGTRDDFGLELRTYGTAKRLGFETTHGGSYVDPLSRKTRQYDVRASLSRRNGDRIDLAIECKALRRSFPLVVSRVRREGGESFHHIVMSHERVPRERTSVLEPIVPIDMKHSRTLVITGASSIYKPGDWVGKSTTQVGHDGKGGFTASDSEFYEKWSQALASADDLVEAAINASETSGQAVIFSVVLPVVVVPESTLWMADYDEVGALENGPHQVPEATVFVDKEYNPVPMFGETVTVSHLHVCTPQGFERFITRIADKGTFWEQVFPMDAMRRAIATTE